VPPGATTERAPDTSIYLLDRGGVSNEAATARPSPPPRRREALMLATTTVTGVSPGTAVINGSYSGFVASLSVPTTSTSVRA
jgi:hypothetical protein